MKRNDRKLKNLKNVRKKDAVKKTSAAPKIPAEKKTQNPPVNKTGVKKAGGNPEKKLPGVSQFESELKRLNYKARFKKLLRSTVYTLIVAAAVAVLVAVLFMPVLRIYGSSMTPTLTEGNIVVSVKDGTIERGDIVGVYYGNKLLIKRCIATEHQWVNIDDDGNVFVDGEQISEPYLSEKALGHTNIELPYQVPDNSIFVMGDHRATSTDSRNTSVGCIDTENVVGKIVFCVWPMDSLGIVK